MPNSCPGSFASSAPAAPSSVPCFSLVRRAAARPFVPGVLLLLVFVPCLPPLLVFDPGVLLRFASGGASVLLLSRFASGRSSGWSTSQLTPVLHMRVAIEPLRACVRVRVRGRVRVRVRVRVRARVRVRVRVRVLVRVRIRVRDMVRAAPA